MNTNLRVSCNFFKFMSIAKCCQDQIIRIEDNFFGVSFFEQDLMSWKDPSDSLLFYSLAVSINKLSEFSLVLELENLQSFRKWNFRVGLFCTFGDFLSDSIGNPVQKWAEIIKRTVFFKLEDSPVISYINIFVYLIQ